MPNIRQLLGKTLDDTIETILNNLKNDQDVMQTRNLLNDVADLLELKGFDAAKLFLLGKLGQGSIHYQVVALLKKIIPILEASDEIKAQPALGGLIIKHLLNLKDIQPCLDVWVEADVYFPPKKQGL